MKNTILLIICLSLVCLIGCKKETFLDLSATPARGFDKLELMARAPFSLAVVTVHFSGDVHYKADAWMVDVQNIDEKFQAHPDKIRSLAEVIDKSGFWGLKDKYVEEVMDATTYTITVEKGGMEKTIKVCGSGHPAALNEIIKKAEEVLGKDILEVGM